MIVKPFECLCLPRPCNSRQVLFAQKLVETQICFGIFTRIFKYECYKKTIFPYYYYVTYYNTVILSLFCEMLSDFSISQRLSLQLVNAKGTSSKVSVAEGLFVTVNVRQPIKFNSNSIIKRVWSYLNNRRCEICIELTTSSSTQNGKYIFY